MKVGTRVRILVDPHHDGIVGMLGTVRSQYDNRITVMIDGKRNKRSGYGCFYFHPSMLEELKGDNKIMDGNYMIATMQFLEGHNTDKTYRYALYDFSILIGDICVVKSAHHGFGLARVVDIETKTDEPIKREIVCKADLSAYEAREAARKRRAELGKLMQERAAKLQEITLFAMLAKEDAEMQKLLGEFNNLEVV